MTLSTGPATIDHTAPGFQADPHGTLTAARARGRFARMPGGELLVLRHADTRAVLGAPTLEPNGVRFQLQRAGVTEGPFFDFAQQLLLNQDGPGHRRIRDIVRRSFTPRSVERFRGIARKRLTSLLEPARQTGRLEFVGEVAETLPIAVVCEFLGVPSTDWDLIARWTLGLSISTGPLTPERRAELDATADAFHTYLDGLIAYRRLHPADDLLSAVIAAQEGNDRLTAVEVRGIVANILQGGTNTVQSLLSIGAYLLATHPDQFRLLRRRPELVPGAVEEILRYEPPIPSTIRAAVEDFPLGEHQVAAGDSVYVSLLSANRDEDVFPDGQRFDVARERSPALTFGSGTHHCLGAAIARLDGQEAVAALTTTFRELHLVEPAAFRPFLPGQTRRIPAIQLAVPAA